MPRIKQEDKDNVRQLTDISLHSPVDPKKTAIPEEQRPSKRARVFVEVPVFSEIQKLKYNNNEEKKSILSKIKNPKVKGEVPSGLNSDTLAERIKRMNCPWFGVNIPQGIRDVAAPRAFFSSIYGGCARRTFPKIARKFLDQHGLNDFMFPKLNYSPHVPVVPGAPGLLFIPGPRANKCEDRGIRRVITCLSNGEWLYMGQYSLTPTASLTLKEVEQQERRFFTTWSTGVFRQNWGHTIALRVAARKQFKCRSPTEAQIRAIDPKKLQNIITPEDVEKAFRKGEEGFGVWEMRCVGYDTKFQEEVADKMVTWVPTPPKLNRNRRENAKRAAAKLSEAGKKRKRSNDSDDDSQNDPNFGGSDSEAAADDET